MVCQDCLDAEADNICDCPGEMGKIRRLHRYVLQCLQDQVFKCQLEECEQQEMKYEVALHHWKHCKYMSTECIYGCGEVLTADTKQHHKELCTKNY